MLITAHLYMLYDCHKLKQVDIRDSMDFIISINSYTLLYRVFQYELNLSIYWRKICWDNWITSMDTTIGINLSKLIYGVSQFKWKLSISPKKIIRLIPDKTLCILWLYGVDEFFASSIPCFGRYFVVVFFWSYQYTFFCEFITQCDLFTSVYTSPTRKIRKQCKPLHAKHFSFKFQVVVWPVVSTQFVAWGD